jgi:hypothetical protein
MTTFAKILRGGCLVLSAAAMLGAVTAARADDLPPELRTIIGTTTGNPTATANGNILALDAAMFDLYDTSLAKFRANILAHHPVILGLFSGAGGRFILYRPGQPPLDAPSVPVEYQLMKSIGHSTMALSEIVMPYLDSPTDQSWRASLLAYRSRMQSALDSVAQCDMEEDWKANNKAILENNIAFMDQVNAAGKITLADLQAFAKKQTPLLKLNIAWAAETQVHHWMDVLDQWKKDLGSDWDQTYAVSNTIYVARQNNVLFSVLAQYFGPDAVNDRLMMFETTDFFTTPEAMLDLMTRVIADRSVGQVFFGNYHLMDYELMGGNGRKAIIAETTKRGMKTFLPPAVPFGSHQWPTLITPGPGATSLDDLD